LWLHSLKVAELLRSAACLHTNQSRSYLNHLVYSFSHCIQDPNVPRLSPSLLYDTTVQTLQTLVVKLFSYRHWQNRTKRHHKSTARLQPSWTGNCLKEGSAEKVYTLRPRSPYLIHWTFSVRLCERWGLRSANAYSVEQLEISNRNSDSKTERPLL